MAVNRMSDGENMSELTDRLPDLWVSVGRHEATAGMSHGPWAKASMLGFAHAELPDGTWVCVKLSIRTKPEPPPEFVVGRWYVRDQLTRRYECVAIRGGRAVLYSRDMFPLTPPLVNRDEWTEVAAPE